MRSLLLEFHRFNDLDTGLLRKGDPYIVVAGDRHPPREFKAPMGQQQFNTLVRALRYEKDAQTRLKALQEVGEATVTFLGTDTLGDIKTGATPLQLDLVVNAAELAALPFEAAIDSGGRPVFAHGDQAVVLTRRVRHDFADSKASWPTSPRVLYAWAAPDGVKEVPSQEHEDALRAALAPWIPAQEGNGGAGVPGDVLTILARATIAVLTAECQAAVDSKKPFTHVHLLAHGYPVGVSGEQRFGVALHADDGSLEAVLPEELTQALAPLSSHPVVITLAACDAANDVNAVIPERSIAHELHRSGFPIVMASQFPFTVAGSTIMAQTFYKALLEGKDVRLALHETRLALYNNQEKTGHDWASLVGYAQLPEGYDHHLREVRLKWVLASLKTIQRRSDKLITQVDKDAARFDRLAELLNTLIAELGGFLQEDEKAGRRDRLEENRGLLGSAQKRLAELCFVRSGLGERDNWRKVMRDALKRSRDWYLKGYQGNPASHWNGVQFLSLDAILDGPIAKPRLWAAALTAAELYEKNEDPEKVIWALGSLAELYLLAPLAGESVPTDAARKALAEMKALVREQPGGDTFPLESTERQLRRYVNWWTTANGFFPATTDLASEAGRLIEELRR